VSGRWKKARYVAEKHEIAARHAPGDWEIVGPPEIREVDAGAAYFSPWRRARAKRLRYPVYEAS